jgi:hypothetical protein
VAPHITITITGRNVGDVAPVVRFTLSFNFFRDNECAATFADLQYEEQTMVAGLLPGLHLAAPVFRRLRGGDVPGDRQVRRALVELQHLPGRLSGRRPAGRIAGTEVRRQRGSVDLRAVAPASTPCLTQAREQLNFRLVDIIYVVFREGVRPHSWRLLEHYSW